MRSDARMEVATGSDGPNGNSVPIYVIMLSIVVDGVEKPFKTRVGEFQEGHQSLAKEFCDWFNAKKNQ